MPLYSSMKKAKQHPLDDEDDNLERDYSAHYKPDEAFNYEEEDEDPTTVFIDIALGSQKHRITLRADSDAGQVAADFSTEHGLD